MYKCPYSECTFESATQEGIDDHCTAARHQEPQGATMKDPEDGRQL
jgi:hypothetical protein